MKQNQLNNLLLLILIAVTIRVIILWITRPEFVGWFNHTYYYYVQTRGLIENGQLPFPEMPLLFYLYSSTAQLLTWFGIELNSAIVNSTRFWMCLISSLLAIPFYVIFRNIYKEQSLPRWIWIFLFASAFYPFSILNMTEFLQKNVLGLFLLAVLIQQSLLFINNKKYKHLGILICLVLIIIFTHLGTAAAVLLYLASFSASYVYHNKASALKLTLSLVAVLVLSLLIFYSLDIQRFEKIGFYLNRVFDSSSIVSIFSSNRADRFTSILTILVPLGITVFFYKGYLKTKENIDYQNSIFWLANIIFFYLLLLPIYDSTLLSRFILFISIPLMFMLVFTVQYVAKKDWVRKLVLVGVTIGIVFIASANIATLFFLNQNRKEIYLDLMEMKKSIDFNKNDLILTRHGAEHISNWFLETKACLITSFSTNDLKKYNRIFILNPKKNNTSLASDTKESSKKYYFMTINIQEPEEAHLIYDSKHIRLLRLENVPQGWKFDANGNWLEYK